MIHLYVNSFKTLVTKMFHSYQNGIVHPENITTKDMDQTLVEKKAKRSYTESMWQKKQSLHISKSDWKNSIRDARTPQPAEIFFNTMRYRSSVTVQSSRYFQSSVSYIKVQIMLKKRK